MLPLKDGFVHIYLYLWSLQLFNIFDVMHQSKWHIAKVKIEFGRHPV
jgi:hypothetical protein